MDERSVVNYADFLSQINQEIEEAEANEAMMLAQTGTTSEAMLNEMAQFLTEMDAAQIENLEGYVVHQMDQQKAQVKNEDTVSPNSDNDATSFAQMQQIDTNLATIGNFLSQLDKTEMAQLNSKI